MSYGNSCGNYRHFGLVLLLFGVFLLPFELPITQAAHGLLADVIGPVYIVFHPLTIVVAGWAISLRSKISSSYVFLLIVLVGIIAISVLFSSWVNQSNVSMALRFIYFGLSSIVVAASIFSKNDYRSKILRSLCFGVIAWSILILLTYMVHFSQTKVFYDRLPERILSLRAPGERIANASLFFDVAGNVNKVANYAVLFMLIAGFARWKEVLTSSAYFFMQTLLVFVLIVTFSRGAFVVLAITSVLFLAVALSRWRAARDQAIRYLLMSVVLLLPVLLSISDGFFRDYWRNLDTVSARINQASGVGGAGLGLPANGGSLGLFDLPVDGAILVFGYGVGSYGQVTFGDTMRGTHNLFLDLWTNGGAAALASVLALFLVPLWVGCRGKFDGWRDEALVGAAGLVAIMILGFREYDLAYLYATCMGGVLVGVFAGMAISRHDITIGN